jgi:MYXO-CTERM domain-containing protein
MDRFRHVHDGYNRRATGGTVSIVASNQGLQPLVRDQTGPLRLKKMEKHMRKAIAVVGISSALAFGGAGIAQAAPFESPAPGTTITLAQADNEDDGDNTGLWGLAGLLGLLGLLGLKRRTDRPTATAAGTAGYGNTPRA